MTIGIIIAILMFVGLVLLVVIGLFEVIKDIVDAVRITERSFVFQDEKSERFWIITKKGKRITVNYGRLSTSGQSLTKTFDTKDECRAEFEKRINEKLEKGYKELSENEKMPAPFAVKQLSETSPFPIPTHLKEIFIPLGDKNSEFHANGMVRCSCGYEHFQIKLVADIEDGIPMYGGIIIKSICNDCKKEYILFDDNKHGWNGFVCCHDDDDVPVSDSELKEWNCSQCQHCNYNVEISIISKGIEDFYEEARIADGEGDFKISDWVNAFSSITISLECADCGDKYLWDYETM